MIFKKITLESKRLEIPRSSRMYSFTKVFILSFESVLRDGPGLLNIDFEKNKFAKILSFLKRCTRRILRLGI